MKIVTLLLSFFFLAGASYAQIPAPVQQSLQDTINYMQSNKRYKGISAAVHWKTYGDWKGTVGLSHPGQPLTHSMVIGIGSNTKTFLSAVILRLVEMGALTLQDSIGKWLAPMQNIKGSITISQLLHHTSGLYNYTQNTAFGDSVNAHPYRVWTKTELMNKFVKAPYFLPGQGWYYSNTNFILAGMIAELAGGKDVAQLVRDIVLTPVGLNNTFFPPYETITSTPARVWTNLGYGYLQSYTLWDQFYSVADAAGGMLSDAADNNKFWVSLFNGDIIKKSTLTTEMMNWELVNNNMSYGLGLMKEKMLGNWTYSHGGNILGQTNGNLADTVNGIYVSVLTNQDSLQNDQIVLGLYKILLNQSKLVTGIDDHNEASIQVYPNPASTTLKINTQRSFEEVSVYGLDGKKLITSHGSFPETTIDVSGLPAGVYYAIISDQSGRIARSFLKE